MPGTAGIRPTVAVRRKSLYVLNVLELPFPGRILDGDNRPEKDIAALPRIDTDQLPEPQKVI